MRRSIFLVLFSLMLSAPAQAGDPRTHIEEGAAKWVAAFNAGDGAAVAALYAPDAALFPPGGQRVDGRAAIGDFWQGAIDSGMTADELRPVEVQANGDLAGEVGIFTLSVPGENGPTKVNGQYIVIWKRIGHTWQLHRDIWNTD